VEYDVSMKRFRVWGRRAYIVVGLVILVTMVMDFNSRMTRLNHLRTQKEHEEQQLLELKLTRAALQEQIAYVSSDDAVEEWAREEGRMMLPGDIVVVPLPDASFVPESVEEELTYPEPDSNWDAWMQWLFFTSP
jgi:cell division protein FtsB